MGWALLMTVILLPIILWGLYLASSHTAVSSYIPPYPHLTDLDFLYRLLISPKYRLMFCLIGKLNLCLEFSVTLIMMQL